VQWIGPLGAQFPAATTRVQSSRSGAGLAERLSWAALVTALAAAVGAALAWWHAARAADR